MNTLYLIYSSFPVPALCCSNNGILHILGRSDFSHEPANHSLDPTRAKSLSGGTFALENTGNAAADVQASTVKAATIVKPRR